MKGANTLLMTFMSLGLCGGGEPDHRRRRANVCAMLGAVWRAPPWPCCSASRPRELDRSRRPAHRQRETFPAAAAADRHGSQHAE